MSELRKPLEPVCLLCGALYKMGEPCDIAKHERLENDLGDFGKRYGRFISPETAAELRKKPDPTFPIDPRIAR